MTGEPEMPAWRNTELTSAEHQALHLHQLGLSQRTIALTLDISRSAVRARLENARRKLERAHRAGAQ